MFSMELEIPFKQIRDYLRSFHLVHHHATPFHSCSLGAMCFERCLFYNYTRARLSQFIENSFWTSIIVFRESWLSRDLEKRTGQFFIQSMGGSSVGLVRVTGGVSSPVIPVGPRYFVWLFSSLALLRLPFLCLLQLLADLAFSTLLPLCQWPFECKKTHCTRIEHEEKAPVLQEAAFIEAVVSPSFDYSSSSVGAYAFRYFVYSYVYMFCMMSLFTLLVKLNFFVKS